MATVDKIPLVEKWSGDFHSAHNPRTPGWVRELQASAAAQFSAAGLPTRKTEAWKYTPVRALEKLSPSVADPALSSAQKTKFPEPVCEAGTVVDIGDGCFTSDLPDGISGATLLPLAKGLELFPEKMQSMLARVELEGVARTFSAVNTAFLDQGLVVHVGENVNAGSLLIRWAFSGEQVAQLNNFRILLLLEPGAELEVIEQFGSSGDTPNALNVVTQIDLSEGAVLNHVRVQGESDNVVLFTSTAVEQAAGSNYCYSGFDLGGGLVRHELVSKLAGAGAEAGFNGAFILDRKRHVDNHVSVEHAAPGCSSTQFFRGVLGGSSRGVFNGRALIMPGADQSKVKQSNSNLLLSALAEMDTKPELEIYADEVEAAHGATVGQLDEAAVFYLRTRGLSENQARRMMTAAFCHAVTDMLTDRILAERIASQVDAVMPGGLPATGDRD